jgi:TM2 domain-containing membrane protein YozV
VYGHPQQQYGHPGPQYGVQQHPFAMYPPGTISPRNRDVIILLNFFTGFLGAHRFYQGKIGTGILMIITFGGCGIWVLVDFFISVFGNYTDAEHRVVAKGYSKGVVTFLFCLLGVYVLFGILYGIAFAMYMSQHY